MKHLYRICFLILPSFLFISCHGQAIPMVLKGDTVKEFADSLPVVFQDKQHIYWFGSVGKGVYRYDGKIILHYTTQHGLCNNRTREIKEDNAGNIYFNTDGGISQFNGQTFQTLIPKGDHAPGENWKLTQDDLWFKGAQDSGVVYRYDGTILHRLKFPKNKVAEDFIAEHPRAQFPNMRFSPYDVYDIYKDRKGNVWFGTGMLGVCRYDGRSFTWITEKELEYGGIAYGVRSIIEDSDGKFWFSNTMNRFEIYPADSSGYLKKEKEFGSSKDRADVDCTYFLSSIMDSTGALWLVTYGVGVWRFDGKTVTHYPVKKGDKTVTLFTICQDYEGVLWLGTHTDGLYRFNGKAFEKFKS